MYIYTAVLPVWPLLFPSHLFHQSLMSLQHFSSSLTHKNVGVDPHSPPLSLWNTHFALMLLTQWYDNLCTDFLRCIHTHGAVEWSFMAALKFSANTAFWFALRQDPHTSSTSLPVHLISLLFITFRCHSGLSTSFIVFVSPPCSSYIFTSVSCSVLTLSSSVVSTLQIFYFHQLFFSFSWTKPLFGPNVSIL